MGRGRAAGVHARDRPDGRGGAHALWLLERAGDGHASRVLLHSVLAIGAATWSPAQAVASSVVGWEAFADPAGRLHVVYVRAQNAPDAPPGIYHRRYAAGPARWSAPGLVRESLYARLLTAEDLRLAGAADDAGNVNVAWYDPRSNTMWTARSPDGGRTWAAPGRVPVADAVSAHLAATGRGEFLALWRVSTGDMTIALSQQRSRDGGDSWDDPLRVLPTLAAPGDEILLQQMDDGRLLLAPGLGGWYGRGCQLPLPSTCRRVARAGSWSRRTPRGYRRAYRRR